MTDVLRSPGRLHADFAKWMLVALPQAEAELVRKRRDGVEQAAEEYAETGYSTVFELVRLLYELPGRTEDVASDLRRVFTDIDPQFAIAGNRLELAILAGAVLSLLMENDSAAGRAAILSVLVADAGGLRARPHTTPFVVLARAARRRSNLDRKAPTAWPILPDSLGQSATAAGVPAEALLQYLRSVQDHARALLDHQREESDIAWWLIGQFSNDLEVPMSELPRLAAPIVLGKELADMTRSPLGPIAHVAILRRALKEVKRLPSRISLRQALEDHTGSWFETLLSTSSGLEDLNGIAPVLTGIDAWHRVGDEAGWRTALARAAKIDADSTWSSLDLAAQTYNECLLVTLSKRDQEEGEQ